MNEFASQTLTPDEDKQERKAQKTFAINLWLLALSQASTNRERGRISQEIAKLEEMITAIENE